MSLTPREHQVVVLVADGLTVKQIASRLGIRARTVYWHWQEALRKSQASSAAQVAATALLQVSDTEEAR